jgi:hypothetical protein
MASRIINYDIDPGTPLIFEIIRDRLGLERSSGSFFGRPLLANYESQVVGPIISKRNAGWNYSACIRNSGLNSYLFRDFRPTTYTIPICVDGLNTFFAPLVADPRGSGLLAMINCYSAFLSIMEESY